MREHKDSVLSVRLERRYLLLLAAESRWSTFLTFHPKEPASLDLRCYYYLAKYATGERELAFKAAESLWMVAQPQAGDCNSLFKVCRITSYNVCYTKLLRATIHRDSAALKASSRSPVAYFAR